MGMPYNKHMSLRRTFAVVATAILILISFTAFSLTYITSELDEASAEIARSVRNVHVAEEMEVSTLLFYQAGNRYALSRERQALLDKEDARRNVERRLAEAESFAPEGTGMLREIRARLREFLAVEAQNATAPLDTRVRETSGPLEATFRAIDRYVAFTLEESARAREEIASANQSADALGAAVIVLLLCGTLGLAWYVNRAVYRPLSNIQSALQTFEYGGALSTAPEEGPEELRRITEAFNQMSARLMRQREQQRQFISGIAHDLRNPLTALKGYIDLLSMTQAPLPPERIQETFSFLSGQIDRMNRLIEDFLEASRIDAGSLTLNLSRIDLRSVVDECVRLFSSSSARHVLRAELPGEAVMIQGDQARIAQVFNNLLSNAIKYSPAGGEVLIQCRTEGGQALVSVADRGIGIPLEDREEIFQPFRRHSQTREQFPGVGLGLSVSKKIVEAHGGRIEMASDPGKGSVFTVVLPAGE